MAPKPADTHQQGSIGSAVNNTQYINTLLHGVAEKVRKPDAFISENERKQYLITVHHLLEGFSFPLPLPTQDGADVQWKGMRSEIELLKNMGEIIAFVFKPQHGRYEVELDQAQKICCRLLGILAASATWLDVVFEAEDGFVTPVALRNEIVAALVQFLQGLGSTIAPTSGHGEDENSDSLGAARSFLQSVVDTVQGLSTSFDMVRVQLT